MPVCLMHCTSVTNAVRISPVCQNSENWVPVCFDQSNRPDATPAIAKLYTMVMLTHLFFIRRTARRSSQSTKRRNISHMKPPIIIVALMRITSFGFLDGECTRFLFSKKECSSPPSNPENTCADCKGAVFQRFRKRSECIKRKI